MRVAVEPLRRAYRLLNHGPTTLLATAAGGRRDVMAAAWVMPIDFEPPRVVAAIAAGTLTRELLEESGEFTLSLPPARMVEAAYGVGKTSGREQDKFQRFGLATSPASRVAAPLVEGCVGWLECRLLGEEDIRARYDLFLAEVVAAWADDRVFRDGEWRFPDDESRTIHHLAGGAFFLTGDRIDSR